MNTNKYYTDISKKSLGKSTFITYDASIKKLLQLVDTDSIHELLLNPDKYYEIIKESIQNINSRITYLIAILAYMRVSELKVSEKVLYNKWYTYMMNDRKERNIREMSNIPTEKQERTNYTWNDILSIRDKLPKDSIEHLVLGMYTYIPSRRQKDYHRFRVYTNPLVDPPFDHNHIHLNSEKYSGPYMFLNDFKNSTKTGNFFNKEIPNVLVEIIKLSLAKNQRDYLFVSNNNQPYSDIKNFTRFINKTLKNIFGNKEMSVNALRHSHSTMVNEIPNITVGERMKYAYKMSHSIKKDLFYAFKNSSKENDQQIHACYSEFVKCATNK